MRKTEETDPFESAEVDLGPGSGGQSGDLQGLDSDEVTELLEEGQSFEAGIVSGIEDAPPADEGEIKTTEVLEDDVPLEYQDEEEDDGL
jgi:hypothetical protein